MSDAKRPKTVADFVEGLVRIGKATLMKELSLSDDQAEAVMVSISTTTVAEYARTWLYVPVKFDLRDGEIWRKYCETGRGPDGQPTAPPFSHARIEELAAEYGRTERAIYNVVAARRRADRAARRFPTNQVGLPGLEDPDQAVAPAAEPSD